MTAVQVPEWGPPVEGYRYLRQRSGRVWYIRRKLGGKWRNTSLLTTDIEEAKRLYEDEVGNTRTRSEDRTVRCGVAFEEFIARTSVKATTKRLYADLWSNWCDDMLGGLRVAEVKKSDIIEVLDRMKHTPSKKTGRLVSTSRRRNCYVMLSSFFTFCIEADYRAEDSHPVTRIGKHRPPMPESNQVPDEIVISEEEIDKIAIQLGTPSRDERRERQTALCLSTLVQIQPEVGGRISEMLALQLSDYHRLAGQLHIERQIDVVNLKAGDPTTWTGNLKGIKEDTIGRCRVVPLSPFANRVLGEYIDTGIREGWLKQGGLLFPSSKGTPRDPRRVTTQIREAAEKAIGRRVVSHHFRHTYASRRVERGVPIDEVAELIGDTVKTTKARYVHRVNRTEFDARIAATGRQ